MTTETTAVRLSPTLHRDFQIGERVSFSLADGKTRWGTITSVSFQHVIFSYIVTLEEPIQVPGWDKPWDTVSLPGGYFDQK